MWKSTKLVKLYLLLIQKLIAYDHLEGDPGLDGGKNVPLFTDILNMVCSCIDNSSPDRYANHYAWLNVNFLLYLLIFVNQPAVLFSKCWRYFLPP